jgi:hypothetical protein
MLIAKVSILFTYIAFIVGCIKYKYFSKELKIIFYFVALGAITEIYTSVQMHFWMKNTRPIGHFYYPASLLILGLFYLQVLRNFIRPVYILTIIIAFLAYSIINTIFIQGLFEYASLVAAIGGLIVFLFSVAFFTKIMIEAKIAKLSTEPLIWINSGLLFYYAGNFFYHMLFNLRLLASMEVTMISIELFVVLNLMFYLIITIGFLMVNKKTVKQKQN